MDLEEARKVNWLSVLGGLVVAWIAGAVIGLGVAFGSFVLFNQAGPVIILAPVVVTVLASWVVYRIARTSMRDFAVGLLIGGCMMALVAGACGALLSGLQNMH
jgi:lipoprotein signal peptidase